MPSRRGSWPMMTRLPITTRFLPRWPISKLCCPRRNLPTKSVAIADFRVLGLLGIGGMAAVFEAEDPRLKRRVALKVLHPAIAARPGSD